MTPPRFLALFVVALAGCPGKTYLALDVTDPADRPLAGAVATAVCDRHDGAAAETDRRGRARLELRERERRRACTVTVARPGFDTARFEVDRFCERPDCQPIGVVLDGGDR